MRERVHNLKTGYVITSDDLFLSHQTQQNLLCAMVSRVAGRMDEIKPTDRLLLHRLREIRQSGECFSHNI